MRSAYRRARCQQVRSPVFGAERRALLKGTGEVQKTAQIARRIVQRDGACPALRPQRAARLLPAPRPTSHWFCRRWYALPRRRGAVVRWRRRGEDANTRQRVCCWRCYAGDKTGKRAMRRDEVRGTPDRVMIWLNVLLCAAEERRA